VHARTDSAEPGDLPINTGMPRALLEKISLWFAIVVGGVLTVATGLYAIAWLIGDAIIRGQEVVSLQFAIATMVAIGFGSFTRWCFEEAAGDKA
jgi:hypothetical protein